jgi:hypothetical protein
MNTLQFQPRVFLTSLSSSSSDVQILAANGKLGNAWPRQGPGCSKFWAGGRSSNKRCPDDLGLQTAPVVAALNHGMSSIPDDRIG